MKLKNKKTGEIVELFEIVRVNDIDNKFYLRLSDNEGRTFKVGFSSLAELNDEWEDYEDPKDHWHIGCEGDVFIDNTERYLKSYSSIGNDFETKEETEKAVERLRAWKRLEDKGFEFCGWCEDIGFRFTKPGAWQTEVQPDLDLLFGGEE